MENNETSAKAARRWTRYGGFRLEFMLVTPFMILGFAKKVAKRRTAG